MVNQPGRRFHTVLHMFSPPIYFVVATAPHGLSLGSQKLLTSTAKRCVVGGRGHWDEDNKQVTSTDILFLIFTCAHFPAETGDFAPGREW